MADGHGEMERERLADGQIGELPGLQTIWRRKSSDFSSSRQRLTQTYRQEMHFPKLVDAT